MRPKVLLLGSSIVLSAFSSQTAFSADMPSRAPTYKAPAVYSPAPVKSWTGFYVGANAGYGWATGTDEVTATGTVVGSATLTDNLKGMIAGGQLGYNWQSGNFVWGLETDLQWSGQKNTTNFTIGTTNLALTDQIDWFGTARLRAGVIVANNWLLYGTGGLAYFGGKQTLTATGGTTGTASVSRTKAGWTLGGGLEVPIANNWTAKLEYLYWRSTWTENTAVGGANYNEKFTVSDSIVRVGANYHF